MKIVEFSATELSKKIRRGELLAEEIIEAYIKQIVKKNGKLNAIVFKCFLEAKKEAIVLDQLAKSGSFKGPLHGIPITIKESISIQGTPATWGIEGRERSVCTKDDPSVLRLKEAGAIIIGKTNAMQLLMGCETVNPIYGKTNNPWNLKRTSGGSSGGEGAAISGLLSPLGIGTDIGGSIRTPAHFCGIHGLKPTSGMIPQATPKEIFHIRKEATTMSTIGPLARSIDDLKVAFEVLSKRTTSYQSIENMRAGVWINDGILEISPSIKRAIEEASDELSKVGVTIIPYKFQEINEQMQAFYGLMCTDGGQGIIKTLGGSKKEKAIENMLKGQRQGETIRKITTFLLRVAGQKIVSENIFPFIGKKTDKEIEDLVRKRENYQQRIIKDLRENHIDFILSPVFPVPALIHGGSHNLSYEGAYNAMMNYLNFPSGAFSLTTVKKGEEVQIRNKRDMVSRTAGRNEEASLGLPVAIQIASLPYQEEVVLSVMKVLETIYQSKPNYPINLLKSKLNNQY